MPSPAGVPSSTVTVAAPAPNAARGADQQRRRAGAAARTGGEDLVHGALGVLGQAGDLVIGVVQAELVVVVVVVVLSHIGVAIFGRVLLLLVDIVLVDLDVLVCEEARHGAAGACTSGAAQVRGRERGCVS
jgi:hypothetical protein